MKKIGLGIAIILAGILVELCKRLSCLLFLDRGTYWIGIRCLGICRKG